MRPCWGKIAKSDIALKQQHKTTGKGDKQYKDGLNTDRNMVYSSKSKTMIIESQTRNICTPPPSPSLYLLSSLFNRSWHVKVHVTPLTNKQITDHTSENSFFLHQQTVIIYKLIVSTPSAAFNRSTAFSWFSPSTL